MKKITLIAVSFVALLAMAGTAHAIYSCELEVTKGESYDPCVVINRVGIRNPFNRPSDENKWIPVGPDMTKAECNERRDDPQTFGVDDDETYFKCGHQNDVRGCDLENITTNINYLEQDKKYCWVGTHDGYETSLILFQVAHDTEALTTGVPSQRLSDNRGSVDIDDTEKFKPIKTHVKKTVRISLDRGEQFIASDGRAFWDIKNRCLGGACEKGNGKNPAGISALVHDRILELSDPDAEGHIPFFHRDNFREDRKVTILAPKDEPSVPISVDMGFDGDTAFYFGGATPATEPFSPRFVIRGWDVELNGGRRFMETTGESKVVFARSRIAVKSSSVQQVFSAGPDTRFDFGDENGLTVNLNNVYIPVFRFYSVPRPRILADLAKDGLEILFSPGERLPTPLEVEGKGVEKCTVIKKQHCTEEGPACFTCKEGSLPVGGDDDGVSYLIFDPICPENEDCHFDIYRYNWWPIFYFGHMFHEDRSLDSVFVYVLGGDYTGLRIEFDLSELEEDDDTSSDSSDNLKIRSEFEVHTSMPATISPDWTIANDDPDEDEEDLECEDGFIEVDGECVQESDQDTNGGSDDGSNTDPDLSTDDDSGSGDPDPVVCGEGEVLIWGTCISESEQDDLNSGDTTEETLSDTGGGCSLMASQGAGSWARFLLILPALLGLWLCRSLRRRRSTNCKPDRSSTKSCPSSHICKCSTKCC